jgi:hypothetical protein
MKKLAVLGAISFVLPLVLALPASAETYKTEFTVACSALWPAVKDTLSNQTNYKVKTMDDAKMTASYKVNHAIHVTVTETVLQRTNKVTLVTQGAGCEMQDVSNYSGVEHDDEGDFKKRVTDSLAKLTGPQPAAAAKPSDPAQPAAPPK